jgi:hypothetical protein
MEKKIMIRDPDQGSIMFIPDHISESLATNFWAKTTKILCCGSGIPVLFNPGSGMEKFRSGIQDKHPGSYFRELSKNFWVKAA